jgi:iron only hydrogenase large subunit-like protein
MKRGFRLAALTAFALSLCATVATAQKLNNSNMEKPQVGAMRDRSLEPRNMRDRSLKPGNGRTSKIQALTGASGGNMTGAEAMGVMFEYQKMEGHEKREERRNARDAAKSVKRSKATKLKQESKTLHQQRQEGDEKYNNALCAGTGNC